MANVREIPAENTDYQLLLSVVPDFDERLEDLRNTNPEMFKELHKRALGNNGWKPLEWWQGAF
jgi:hypothetical protein